MFSSNRPVTRWKDKPTRMHITLQVTYPNVGGAGLDQQDLILPRCLSSFWHSILNDFDHNYAVFTCGQRNMQTLH